MCDIKTGTHLCCIYETDEEHCSLISTLLKQGIKQNEKILYIADVHTAESMLKKLLDNGMNTKILLKSGQLTIIKASEAYMREGVFNPEAMITLLQKETEQALAEGYSALRVTSEMSWALQELPSSERLIEYDSKLNEFFPNSNCIAICLYDIRQFKPEILFDVFTTHPLIAVGEEVYDNYYYLTPTDFLGENRSITKLRNWLDNLTARRHAEQNLLHLSNAVKRTLDCIIISNLEGKVIDVNDATLKIFESDEKKDLLGKNIVNFIAPEEREKAQAVIKKVLENDYHGTQEYKIETKTGCKIPVETYLDLMINDDGKPIGFIGVFRDIRERKFVEEKLKESEEKYRTLINASPEAITLIGLDGNILDCNNVVEKITGKKKNELVGKPLADFNMFNNEDISKLLEIFPKDKNSEHIGPLDMAFQFAKETGWVEVFPTILTKENEVQALQLIVRDITERKKAEEEMKRRLMKFKLEDGKVYLIKESMLSVSIEAIRDLLAVNYHGLVVSRSPEKYFKNIKVKNSFDYLWLAEKGEENSLLPKIEAIEKKIENLPRNSVIFIDRMDYLIFKNGFRKIVTFVHHLREYAFLKSLIIIISIDPSTLSKQELRLLEKECEEIQPRLNFKKLPDEQLKILRFIYENNITGEKPTYTNIGQELGISKPTVRKRIRLLTSTGYVIETIKGRNKVVELTELGRNSFFK